MFELVRTVYSIKPTILSILSTIFPKIQLIYILFNRLYSNKSIRIDQEMSDKTRNE